MLTRFWLSSLDSDGAGTLLYPRPLDTGALGLALAAAYTTAGADTSIVWDSFPIAGVYPDAGARLADTSRVAGEVGDVWHQTNDDTYWKLTAAPSTWAAYVPPPPAHIGGGGLSAASFPNPIPLASPAPAGVPVGGWSGGSAGEYYAITSDPEGAFIATGQVGTGTDQQGHGLSVTRNGAAATVTIAPGLAVLPGAYALGIGTYNDGGDDLGITWGARFNVA